MVMQNSAEIIKIMTNFYHLSFKEIDTQGFNLASLSTVKAVLSPDHISALDKQIQQLHAIEAKINQHLPSVTILQDFFNLLNNLKRL